MALVKSLVLFAVKDLVYQGERMPVGSNPYSPETRGPIVGGEIAVGKNISGVIGYALPSGPEVAAYGIGVCSPGCDDLMSAGGARVKSKIPSSEKTDRPCKILI